MNEISTMVFYLLSTVAQVFAAILGFFIVGQIYIHELIGKLNEKNEAYQKETGCKGIPNILVKDKVTEQVKNIYKLLILIILLSFAGIFLNVFDFIHENMISIPMNLILPIIILVLSIYVMKKLYDFISTWFG